MSTSPSPLSLPPFLFVALQARKQQVTKTKWLQTVSEINRWLFLGGKEAHSCYYNTHAHSALFKTSDRKRPLFPPLQFVLFFFPLVLFPLIPSLSHTISLGPDTLYILLVLITTPLPLLSPNYPHPHTHTHFPFFFVFVSPLLIRFASLTNPPELSLDESRASYGGRR